MRGRRPWAVAILALLPGFWPYWYYRLNRQLRDLGGARLADSRPGASLFAVTLGALVVIPAAVSLWRTTTRLEACEHAAAMPIGRSASFGLMLSGLLGAVLAPLLLGFTVPGLGAAATFALELAAATALVQRRLNAFVSRPEPKRRTIGSGSNRPDTSRGGAAAAPTGN